MNLKKYFVFVRGKREEIIRKVTDISHHMPKEGYHYDLGFCYIFKKRRVVKRLHGFMWWFIPGSFDNWGSPIVTDEQHGYIQLGLFGGNND